MPVIDELKDNETKPTPQFTPRVENNPFTQAPAPSNPYEAEAGKNVFSYWQQAAAPSKKPGEMSVYLWGRKGDLRPAVYNPQVNAQIRKPYWSEPGRVVRYKQMLDTTPPEIQVPDWLDKQKVNSLYSYLEFINPGKKAEDWDAIHPDDPNYSMVETLTAPPQDLLPVAERDPVTQANDLIEGWKKRYEEQYAKYDQMVNDYNAEVANRYAEETAQQNEVDFAKLEPFQQFLVATQAVTPGKNKPEWMENVAAGSMGVKTGMGAMSTIGMFTGVLGAATASGSTIGPIGAAIGAAVGLGAGVYAAYKAKTGDVVGANQIMMMFNKPAEWTEQLMGSVAAKEELAGLGADITKLNSRDFFEAGRSFYESKFYELGNLEANLISQAAHLINPKWSSGMTADLGQVWQIQKGIVEPQAIRQGFMAGTPLAEAAMRLYNGEDSTLVYEDMVDRYGYSGTKADFLLQSWVDPTQYLPFLVSVGGEWIAGQAKNPILAESFRAQRGNLAADAMPGYLQMPIQMGLSLYNRIVLKNTPKGQLPKFINFRPSGGIFDVLGEYRFNLRTAASPMGVMPKLTDDFTGLDRWIAGIDKETGMPKESVGLDSQGQVANKRMRNMLSGKTPLAKVLLLKDNLAGAIENLWERSGHNIDLLPDEINKVIAGKASVVAGDAGTYFYDSPEARALAGALKATMNNSRVKNLVAAWKTMAPQRALLDDLSAGLKIKPEEILIRIEKGETDALLLEFKNSGVPSTNGAMRSLTNNTLDAEVLKSLLKTMIRDKIPANKDLMFLKLTNEIDRSMGDYLVKNYGVPENEAPLFRAARLNKSIQSLVLLGLNPNFLVKNFVNNISTMAYQRVGGLYSADMNQIVYDKYGIARPARADEGYSTIGIIPKSKKGGKDLIDKAQSVVSKVTEKGAVISNLSRKVEQACSDSVVATGIEFVMREDLVSGRGLAELPALVQTELRNKGYDPNDITSIVRVTFNADDLMAGPNKRTTVNVKMNEAVEATFRQLGIDPEIGNDFISKTGVADALTRYINDEGMTFDQALNTYQRTVDYHVSQLRAEEILDTYADTALVIKNSGMPGGVHLFNQLQQEEYTFDNQMQRLLYEATEESRAIHSQITKDTPLAERTRIEADANAHYHIRYLERANLMQQHIEERINVLAPILNAMDADNPAQARYINAILAEHKAYVKFEDDKLAAQDLFFDPNSGTAKASWGEAQLKVKEAFEAYQEKRIPIRKELYDATVGLFGDDANVVNKVKTWLDATGKIQDQIEKTNQRFEEYLRRQEGAGDRDAAWLKRNQYVEKLQAKTLTDDYNLGNALEEAIRTTPEPGASTTPGVPEPEVPDLDFNVEQAHSTGRYVMDPVTRERVWVKEGQPRPAREIDPVTGEFISDTNPSPNALNQPIYNDEPFSWKDVPEDPTKIQNREAYLAYKKIEDTAYKSYTSKRTLTAEDGSEYTLVNQKIPDEVFAAAQEAWLKYRRAKEQGKPAAQFYSKAYLDGLVSQHHDRIYGKKQMPDSIVAKPTDSTGITTEIDTQPTLNSDAVNRIALQDSANIPEIKGTYARLIESAYPKKVAELSDEVIRNNPGGNIEIDRHQYVVQKVNNDLVSGMVILEDAGMPTGNTKSLKRIRELIAHYDKEFIDIAEKAEYRKTAEYLLAKSIEAANSIPKLIDPNGQHSDTAEFIYSAKSKPAIDETYDEYQVKADTQKRLLNINRIEQKYRGGWINKNATELQELTSVIEADFRMTHEEARAAVALMCVKAEEYSFRTGQIDPMTYMRRYQYERVADGFIAGETPIEIKSADTGRSFLDPERGKWVIQASKKANATTWLHEMAHTWITDLDADDINILAKWSGYKSADELMQAERHFRTTVLKPGEKPDTEYLDFVRAQENIVAAFEQVYYKRELPLNELQMATASPSIVRGFQRLLVNFRDWIIKLYKNMSGGAATGQSQWMPTKHNAVYGIEISREVSTALYHLYNGYRKDQVWLGDPSLEHLPVSITYLDDLYSTMNGGKHLNPKMYDIEAADLQSVKDLASPRVEVIPEPIKTLAVDQINESAINNTSPKSRGGFDSRGKGTPAGDGKDKAMRQIASYFVGELADDTKASSTKTSRDTINWKKDKTNNVVMLARNAEFNNKPLADATKMEILNHHNAGRTFVVGDMPGVDSAFVDYLNEIGADYTIYYTGNTNRLSKTFAKQSFIQHEKKISPTPQGNFGKNQPVDLAYQYYNNLGEDTRTVLVNQIKNYAAAPEKIKPGSSLYDYLQTNKVTAERLATAIENIELGKYSPDNNLQFHLVYRAIDDLKGSIPELSSLLNLTPADQFNNRITELNTVRLVPLIKLAELDFDPTNGYVRANARYAKVDFLEETYAKYQDLIDELRAMNKARSKAAHEERRPELLNYYMDENNNPNVTRGTQELLDNLLNEQAAIDAGKAPAIQKPLLSEEATGEMIIRVRSSMNKMRKIIHTYEQFSAGTYLKSVKPNAKYDDPSYGLVGGSEMVLDNIYKAPEINTGLHDPTIPVELGYPNRYRNLSESSWTPEQKRSYEAFTDKLNSQEELTAMAGMSPEERDAYILERSRILDQEPEPKKGAAGDRYFTEPPRWTQNPEDQAMLKYAEEPETPYYKRKDLYTFETEFENAFVKTKGKGPEWAQMVERANKLRNSILDDFAYEDIAMPKNQTEMLEYIQDLLFPRMKNVADPVADYTFNAKRRIIQYNQLSIKEYHAKYPNALYQPDPGPLLHNNLDSVATTLKQGKAWREQAANVSVMLKTLRDNYNANTKSYGYKGIDQLSPEAKALFDTWLKDAGVHLGSVKQKAVRYGLAQRDAALLNYGDRNGFDNYLDMLFPYQFWYTRSMQEWIKRSLNRPAILALAGRRQAMAEKLGKDLGEYPTRLQGKYKIPWAFAEEWMGDSVYINPWMDLMPVNQLMQPLSQLNQAYTGLRPDLELQEMVRNKEITQEQMDYAMAHQDDENWNKAMSLAQEQNQGTDDPYSLLSMMMTPNWLINEVEAKVTGRKLPNMPLTNLGLTIQSQGDTIGIAVGKADPKLGDSIKDILTWTGKRFEGPEKLIRGSNFAYYGEWGNWLVKRELSNMAAEGKPVDAIMRSMIEQKGDLWAEASKRVRDQVAMKTPGNLLARTIEEGEYANMPWALVATLFPAGIFPQGELEQLGLKADMQKAWDVAAQTGDKTMMNDWFRAHPEYNARAALNDDDRTMLKKFLVNQIMDAYTSEANINKSLIKAHLGDDFLNKILNPDSASGRIDYKALDLNKLVDWARTLKKEIPITEETMQLPIQGEKIATYSPEEIAELNTWFQEREAKYPQHAELNEQYSNLTNDRDKKIFLAKYPELKEYWDYAKAYREAHPTVKTWSAKYANPDEVAHDPYYGLDPAKIQGYYDYKQANFPNVGWLNTEYFQIPEKNYAAKRAFLNKYPELKNYWDWKDAAEQADPEYLYYNQMQDAMYTKKDIEVRKPADLKPGQIAKALAVMEMDDFVKQDLLDYYVRGTELPFGTRAYLQDLWEQRGKPGSDFQEFIDNLF